MEFFREVHHAGLDISALKNPLSIGNLTNLCAALKRGWLGKAQ